jgi:hypothetical protein
MRLAKVRGAVKASKRPTAGVAAVGRPHILHDVSTVPSRSRPRRCHAWSVRITVNGEPSCIGGPYGNFPSGARGLSHWLSPDHGKHWFPIGRPGADLFRVQNRRWSPGLDSVMPWP